MTRFPSELADAANTAREVLIEMVAEADDSLMEKFFDAGTLTQEELLSGLKRSVAAGRIFPVLCASATRTSGSSRCSTRIVAYVPAASGAAVHREGSANGQTRRANRNRPLAGRRPRSSGRPSPIRSPGASRCSG